MIGHLEPGLGPLDLEGLPEPARREAPAHLASCDPCAAQFAAAADAFAAIGLSIPPEAPAARAKERLLASVRTVGRFERFAAQVAALLDVGVAKAKEFLARVDDPAAWEEMPLPGVFHFDLEGGPAVADAVAGFVRIQPGQVFPEHGHLGEEAALALQGTCVEDNGRVTRAGDLVRMQPGQQHALTALPGPDFIYLAVVQRGITMFGMEITKGKPGA
jgi:anti-sigma factor ChrR (cupin superfamily)